MLAWRLHLHADHQPPVSTYGNKWATQASEHEWELLLKPPHGGEPGECWGHAGMTDYLPVYSGAGDRLGIGLFPTPVSKVKLLQVVFSVLIFIGHLFGCQTVGY